MCFVGASALALVALVGPSFAPARAQDADPEAGRPTAFVADAEAFSVQVNVNTVPPQVISELLNAKAPWATSRFEAGAASNAAASMFNPGLAVTGGLSLLCQVGIPCGDIPGFPPPYPLMAVASSPLQVDAAAQINGPTLAVGSLTVTAGDAHAHAGRDKVTAAATLAGNTLGSGPGVLLRVGHATSSNNLEFAGDGTLIATAIAAVSDVTVLGLLHIDSIEARSVSSANANGTQSNDVHLDVQGATLAGIPVVIGEDGLNLGGNAQGGDLLTQLGQTLSPVLAAFRGSIRTIGVTDTKDPTNGPTASATGLQISLFPNTDTALGVSPTATVLLGFAGTHSYAFNAEPFVPTASDDGSGGGFTSPGDTSGSTFIPGTEGTQGSVTSGPPAGPSTGGGSVTERIASLLSGAAADRLKLFYLAWTLSLIGLAIGSRFRTARLTTVSNGGSDGS